MPNNLIDEIKNKIQALPDAGQYTSDTPRTADMVSDIPVDGLFSDQVERVKWCKDVRSNIDIILKCMYNKTSYLTYFTNPRLFTDDTSLKTTSAICLELIEAVQSKSPILGYGFNTETMQAARECVRQVIIITSQLLAVDLTGANQAMLGGIHISNTLFGPDRYWCPEADKNLITLLVNPPKEFQFLRLTRPEITELIAEIQVKIKTVPTINPDTDILVGTATAATLLILTARYLSKRGPAAPPRGEEYVELVDPKDNPGSGGGGSCLYKDNPLEDIYHNTNPIDPCDDRNEKEMQDMSKVKSVYKSMKGALAIKPKFTDALIGTALNRMVVDLIAPRPTLTQVFNPNGELNVVETQSNRRDYDIGMGYRKRIEKDETEQAKELRHEVRIAESQIQSIGAAINRDNEPLSNNQRRIVERALNLITVSYLWYDDIAALVHRRAILNDDSLYLVITEAIQRYAVNTIRDRGSGVSVEEVANTISMMHKVGYDKTKMDAATQILTIGINRVNSFIYKVYPKLKVDDDGNVPLEGEDLGGGMVAGPAGARRVRTMGKVRQAAGGHRDNEVMEGPEEKREEAAPPVRREDDAPRSFVGHEPIPILVDYVPPEKKEEAAPPEKVEDNLRSVAGSEAPPMGEEGPDASFAAGLKGSGVDLPPVWRRMVEARVRHKPKPQKIVVHLPPKLEDE